MSESFHDAGTMGSEEPWRSLIEEGLISLDEHGQIRSVAVRLWGEVQELELHLLDGWSLAFCGELRGGDFLIQVPHELLEECSGMVELLASEEFWHEWGAWAVEDWSVELTLDSRYVGTFAREGGSWRMTELADRWKRGEVEHPPLDRALLELRAGTMEPEALRAEIKRILASGTDQQKAMAMRALRFVQPPSPSGTNPRPPSPGRRRR